MVRSLLCAAALAALLSACGQPASETAATRFNDVVATLEQGASPASMPAALPLRGREGEPCANSACGYEELRANYPSGQYPINCRNIQVVARHEGKPLGLDAYAACLEAEENGALADFLLRVEQENRR